MCDCEVRVKAELQKLYTGATDILGQYELLSGRSYMEYEITMPERKKPRTKMVLHSYCPHCGQKYDTDGGKKNETT